VVLDGPRRNRQALSDRAVRKSLGDQLQHLNLALCQSAPTTAATRGPLAGSGCHGFDRVRIQPPYPDQVSQVLDRLARRVWPPVRTLGGQRLQDIGRRQDTGRHRELHGVGVAVVARPVQAFVVRSRQSCQRRKPRGAGEDLLGVVGVQPDLQPGVAAQTTSPLPDPARHCHPTKVVDIARAPDITNLLWPEP
jgi:hypothetical protein